MNIRNRKTRAARLFTLVEMIGVLAIIAILAAVLVPRVLDAIEDARVANVVQSIHTLQSAVTDYATKTPLTAVVGLEPALITAGKITSKFDAKITGVASSVDVVAATVAAGAPAGGTNFDLDGTAANGKITAGSMVVRLTLTAVPSMVAAKLNNSIDSGLPVVAPGVAQLTGRVTLAAAGATQTVYIYIAHVNP